MSDRHRAPRRKVRSVKRVGGYGSTEWLISLDCGHTERRKRTPKAPHVGCSACVSDERLAVAMLMMPDDRTVTPPDNDSEVMFQVAMISAGIAARLGIEPEMVDVRVTATGSGLQMEGASVWIPAETLKFFL